jgi:hypothetical protein
VALVGEQLQMHFLKTHNNKKTTMMPSPQNAQLKALPGIYSVLQLYTALCDTL